MSLLYAFIIDEQNSFCLCQAFSSERVAVAAIIKYNAYALAFKR